MTDSADDFWANRFHCCALAAGFIAAGEGRLHDSLYVRELAYRLFERGEFRRQASAKGERPRRIGGYVAVHFQTPPAERKAGCNHEPNEEEET